MNQNIPKLYQLTSTIILSVIVLFVFIFSQMLGLVMFAPLYLQIDNLPIENQIALASSNGSVTSLSAILTLFMLVVSVWLMIWWKKGSITAFLAIKGFGLKDFLICSIALLLLNALISGVTIWLEREPMIFMEELALTAHPLWLLIVAIVIIVPIYEELMFRGFIWSNLATSQLGVWGVSIVTSIIFALIHLQYGVVEWFGILALAMLFSYARIRSGSLLLPISLHMINNALAMTEFFW